MERASSLAVYRTKVVVTDEHFLPVPLDDLVGALAGAQYPTSVLQGDHSFLLKLLGLLLMLQVWAA